MNRLEGRDRRHINFLRQTALNEPSWITVIQRHLFGEFQFKKNFSIPIHVCERFVPRAIFQASNKSKNANRTHLEGFDFFHQFHLNLVVFFLSFGWLSLGLILKLYLTKNTPTADKQQFGHENQSYWIVIYWSKSAMWIEQGQITLWEPKNPLFSNLCCLHFLSGLYFSRWD